MIVGLIFAGKQLVKWLYTFVLQHLKGVNFLVAQNASDMILVEFQQVGWSISPLFWLMQYLA